jgi:hypothetical protein
MYQDTPQTEEGTVSGPIETPTNVETVEDIRSYPLAEIEFAVTVPKNTPPEQTVYISFLDEITGLAINSVQHEMTLDDSIEIDGAHTYKISIPFAVGSTIKYRYTRQADSIKVLEHVFTGEPVRYRLLQVNGPSTVNDIVSRWTDTTFIGSSGRIVGRATDQSSEQPIANLLIAVGGTQTFTDEDGSFQIDGLPPGIHNLVGYAMDGAYNTFQQGALLAADLPTLTPIVLLPREFVDIEFLVKLPDNTPPVIPVRLAGNLEQLGNTFSTLSGGFSSSVESMPILETRSDELYSVTLRLPVGSYVRYKYTLGDGFWNAERTTDGEFRIRQVIVSDQDTTLGDIVKSWSASQNQSIAFDVSVPINTPPADYVSIQFNSIFGWTEPIPMWSLGDNRWVYVLFSPLNLPGNINYRYCRNNQCGFADDIETPGDYSSGRPIDMMDIPATYTDQVTGWTDISDN